MHPPSSKKEKAPSHFKPGRTPKQHERHYVMHNYHDYADSPDDPALAPIRRRKGGVTVPFPIVLHRVITQVEADGLGHIFGWQPHGRCFLVHKAKQFIEIIMPKYFKQSKITSFQRQLNLYGFNRITKGPDAQGYYHEHFLRGREYLAKRMLRQRIKGTKIKGAACPEAEPDFYAMRSVGVPGEILPTVLARSARTVSVESSLVSSDDMSHASSSEESHHTEDCSTEASRTNNSPTQHTQDKEVDMEMSTSTTSSSFPTKVIQFPNTIVSTMSDDKPEENGLCTFIVPSNTDWEREEDSCTVDENQLPVLDTSDPADALLMELHKMNPLETFDFVEDPSYKNGFSNDYLFNVLEKDEALGKMLHRVLDEYIQ